MTRKSISEAEIIEKLVADGENTEAWEAPTTVSPSHSPRPEWYGRRKHIDRSSSRDDIDNPECLPKRGILRVKMKDGSIRRIDLSQAEEITIEP